MTNTNNSDSMIINNSISEISIADADIPFFGPYEREVEAQLDQIRHTDIETTKEYYYFTHQTDEIKAKQLEKVVANM